MKESSIGALALAGVVHMTRQQLADIALVEHQAARRALARGDMTALADHANEVTRICAASHRGEQRP